MITNHQEGSLSYIPRRVATWMGVQICMSIAGLGAATIAVYDNFSTGSLSLEDQTASYSGLADFDIIVSVPGSVTAPFGLARALSHYGPSTMNSIGVCFQTIAFTSAERRELRTAQADAFWEFSVLGSDTPFEMFYFRETGAYGWWLTDLTSNSLVAAEEGSGGYGGDLKTGTLLLGHRYRLTERARTGGSSDEIAQMDFRVGADVVFLAPEIELQTLAGEAVHSGGSWDTEVCIAGEPRAFTFIIRNTGTGVLSGIAVTAEGTDATEFTVAVPVGIKVPSGESVGFDITAAPKTGGSKSATLRITTNDADENPYLVQVQILALSAAADWDGDGMNDAGEFKLSSLGFDWQIAQSEMVTAYFDAANTNGLFTKSQMRAIHADAPLLFRDSATGLITLILRLQQSADLHHFEPMPMIGATISGEGEVVFRYHPSGDTAFFRLSAQ